MNIYFCVVFAVHSLLYARVHFIIFFTFKDDLLAGLGTIDSQASSGASLFQTKNKGYYVKTLTDKEFKFLSDMIDGYLTHFQTNPKSLLVKIIGVYTYNSQHVYVMTNIFATDVVDGLPSIRRRFDLKGSFINRDVIK